MDGILRALAKKRTPWKEVGYFTLKFALPKLSNYFADITPTTGILFISVQIAHPFRKLGEFWKWDTAMDIIHENRTSLLPNMKMQF